MNTDRIVHLRQRVAEQGGALADEVHAALTWALSLSGPVALADKASWEVVRCECWSEEVDGHTWYRTHADQLPLDLEDETRHDVSRALRYLGERQLLLIHSNYPYLARACPALEALCS